MTNLIRNFPVEPRRVPFGKEALVIDTNIRVEDLAYLSPIEGESNPDPRFYEPSRAMQWGWRDITERVAWYAPATPPDADLESEVILVYRFERVVPLNTIRFEIADYPCNWSVWFYDVRRDIVTQMANRAGHLLGGSERGFALDDRTLGEGWSSYDHKLPYIETNLIELRMDRRVAPELLPSIYQNLKKAKEAFPYPLAVRNVQFEYRVDSREDLPPDDDDDRQFIHPLGFNQRVKVQDQDASNTLDGDTDTFWMSEPQPVAYAVVPFYLDVRDAVGEGQLIDRLEMVPVNAAGVKMNIYHSLDDEHGDFALSKARRDLDAAGGAEASEAGLVVSDGMAVSIGNDLVNLDLSKDWVVGLVYSPGYPADTVTTDLKWLWQFTNATQDIGIAYNPASDRFELRQGGVVLADSADQTFATDDELVVVTGYVWNDDDPEYLSGYYVLVTPRGTVGTVDYSTGTAPTGFRPTTLTLGSDEGAAVSAEGTINRVWIRQESYNTPVVDAFTSNADVFITGAGPWDRVNGFWNTVFRARLLGSLEARIGPGEGFYEPKEWVPIPNDYVMKRGITHLPPTYAKYLKLEFTNLSPQPYRNKQLVSKFVMFHPTWVVAWKRKAFATRRRVAWKPNRRVRKGRWVPPRRRKANRRLRNQLERQYMVSTPGYLPVEQFLETETWDASVGDAELTVVNEMEFDAYSTRFWRTARHEYDVRSIDMVQGEAYFVGLREIKAYRVDYVVANDEPEYIETFHDTNHVDVATMTHDNVNGFYSAGAALEHFESDTFESVSDFDALQLAVIDSEWESQMSDGAMSLVTYDHIEALTDTLQEVVTERFIGEGAGNVLLFSPDNAAAAYGVRTVAGLVSSTAVAPEPWDTAAETWDGASSWDAVGVGLESGGTRVSVMARFLLPDTNRGDYELRLYQQGNLVKSRRLAPPAKQWFEAELGYIANPGETDFQAELVQTDFSIEESFALDFLGIFQHPVKWEVSNDGGATWKNAGLMVNNPSAFITFDTPGNLLRVRAIAQRAGVTVVGYTAVPWYIESPLVKRVPIDYVPPWGVSERSDLLHPKHKAMFQRWNHYFPRRYSLRHPGRVPVSGTGMSPYP